MARKVHASLDFLSTNRIVNLADPQAAGDAANRGYVDAVVEGLAWKDDVRVASTANINLSAPGSAIDSVTMSAGNSFLAKDQIAGAENGIYIWNGASVPATRRLDANTWNELIQAIVPVAEGTSAGAQFRQTIVSGTLGTTALVFTNFNAGAPAATESVAGIAKIATQTLTDQGTDDERFITPLKLNTWSGRMRKYSASVGDGSATAYTVTHNFNTRDVVVNVYNASTYEEIICDVERTTVNTVTLTFGAAPSSNAFRVVVVA